MLSLFVSVSNVFPLTIDRVILSSDSNLDYLSFWPIVAKAWRDIVGVKPTLFLIAGEEVKIDESLGDVIRIKPIPGIPTSYQARVIRLLAPGLFPDEVSIVSDIDLVPLSRQLFIKPLQDVPDNHFVSFNYRCSHTGLFKQFPKRYFMSYSVAKGKTFSELFGLYSIDKIPEKMCEWYDLQLSSQLAGGVRELDEYILTSALYNWPLKEARHCEQASIRYSVFCGACAAKSFAISSTSPRWT